MKKFLSFQFLFLLFALAGCGAMAPGVFQAGQGKMDGSSSQTAVKQDDGVVNTIITNPDGGPTGPAPIVAGSSGPVEAGPSSTPAAAAPPTASPFAAPAPAAPAPPATGGSGSSSSGTVDTSAPVASAGDPKSAKADPMPASDCYEAYNINFVSDDKLFTDDDSTTPFSKDEAKPTALHSSPTGTFGGDYLLEAYLPTSMTSTALSWESNNLKGYVRILVYPPFGKEPTYRDEPITDTVFDLSPVPSVGPGRTKTMTVSRYNLAIDDFPVEAGSTIKLYYVHMSGWGTKYKGECIGAIREPPEPSLDAASPYKDKAKEEFEKLMNLEWNPKDKDGRLVHLLAVMSVPMPKMQKIDKKVDLPVK